MAGHATDALVEAEGHQFPFVLAADQRVVRLVGDHAREVELLRVRERLHQVPAGVVRATDVSQLARAHKVVERRDDFLDRRHRVEAVELEQVDVVRAESLEGLIHRPDESVAGGADLVRTLTVREGGFR